MMLRRRKPRVSSKKPCFASDTNAFTVQGACWLSRLTLMSPRFVAMVIESGRSEGGLPGGGETFLAVPEGSCA